MKQQNQLDLQKLVNDEGVAAVAEALGRICEANAKAAWGGAPDSVTTRQRKTWQKSALSLVTVAAILRAEC